MVRSPIAANEASAIGSLRSISLACAAHAAEHKGYPPSLASLWPGPHRKSIRDADQIEGLLASGRKSGYTFTYTVVDADGDGIADAYSVHADPTERGVTGIRHFYTDQTGVIRASVDSPASANNLPIS